MNNSSRLEIPLRWDLLQKLIGPGDSFIKYLENKYSAKISTKEDCLVLEVDRGHPLVDVVNKLIQLCRSKEFLEWEDVETVVRLNMIGNREESDSAADDKILENAQVRIRAKTPNQKKYHQAILDNEIVFAIGPAGTGKTFIAVAAAVAQFQRGAVERIVLVRPVVEAGEKLGYLPGDIKEKVDPFFKPLYDALFYMLPPEQVKKYIDREVFEIAPLAYMRGRTLNHAIVILDEAQNTTNMQMKMFLTRLGVNSRAIITGDITQIDLENPNTSGLKQAADILKNVIGIGFVYLDSNDVVRHKLVSDIIRAYNDYKN